jgi:hypothetical protein
MRFLLPRLSVVPCLVALALLGACKVQDPSPGDSGATDDDASSDAASFLPDGSESPPSPDPAAAPDSRPPLSSPEKPEDFARWERDPVRAKRKSELLDRPLLVLFTGLAWSTNARRLGEEVFLSKSFNALARDRLTLLYLDFPQNTRDAPQALQYFKDYYKVQGLPSVIILQKDGTVAFRKTGYVPGKAKDYFAELEKAVQALPRPE